MKKKKLYQRPQTAVMQVELESPICSGSVMYATEEKHVQINNQNFADMNGSNDFSNDAWQVDNTASGN